MLPWKTFGIPMGLRGYQWVPKGSVWDETIGFLWAFHGNTHGVLMGFPIGDFWCPMGFPMGVPVVFRRASKGIPKGFPWRYPRGTLFSPTP